MSAIEPFDETPMDRRGAGRAPRALPVGSLGRHTPAWWGVAGLIATESALFAYLLFSYFYLQSQDVTAWPPSGPLPLLYSIPTTAALLISGFSVWWARRSILVGSRVGLFIGLIVTLALGSLYIVLQLLDWHSEPFHFTDGAYTSLYFTITAAHMVHALVGMLLLLAAVIWSAIGYITPQRCTTITVAMLYWWFVVVVWLAVFFTLYALPYLGQH